MSPDRCTVTLSRPAAAFLGATVGFMNQVKSLPAGDAEALRTSAWLEEIAAAVAIALDEKRHDA